jgi:nucleoside-diphosphate-sugar epimerase
MPHRRERVLVTGGSGFIGACLVRTLVAEENEVHLVLRRESNLWRLAGLQEKIASHWGDLRDEESVRQVVGASRPDVIYHLAAEGAVVSTASRASILATNLLGTANLLEALRGRDYRAFVNVGSSSEYGHKDQPMREGDVLQPRTDYAVSKAAATMLCQAESVRGAPIATVRVFSAYGPGEAAERLVPYLLACCLHGRRPRVTAGRQPRDFIFVEDVVSLIRRAAHQPNVHGKILHAGTGRQTTVRQMVETVLEICAGSSSSADYGACPERPDEPAIWVADIAETTALTGWRPQYDLRSGIARTWEWFQSTAPARAA